MNTKMLDLMLESCNNIQEDAQIFKRENIKLLADKDMTRQFAEVTQLIRLASVRIKDVKEALEGAK